MKGKRAELLIIDPQNDFCNPKGALPVGGADKDMERLAAMITRLKDRIFDIHVTLDTHHYIDIAHPGFWVDSKGQSPEALKTLITVADVESRKWTPRNPQWYDRALAYVKSLQANNRYILVVWPPHCLIGTPGHNVFPVVADALLEWEKDFAIVDYVTKGSNIWTEHYSAVIADVPDQEDPTTLLNTRLIQTLQESDIVYLSGEALSHCVANTVRDIANNFGDDNIKKLVLLEDTSSNVGTFEKLGQDFVTEMSKRGMKIQKSTDVRI